LAVNSEWPIEFASIASAGYYVALRIGFAFPLEERNEFPAAWVSHYTKNGLMLRDPVVRWAYDNSGATRWSNLLQDDPHNVLSAARGFGLSYGAVICCSTPGAQELRSYGTFAKSNREFENEELTVLECLLRQLHDSTAPPGNLTNAELEALKLVKEGMRLKEVAYQLGVSEGAIKQRLAGAKRKFGARTNAHAATLATEYRLI